MDNSSDINFTLRPAKSVQRKMLLEAFRRLSHISDLSRYRYIGFGSRFFTDFALFHRQLHINGMISIEKESENYERFNFNKPFRCIKMEYGHSNDILPRLDWKQLTILWLDYTCKLNKEVLADISVFCRSACPGSLIILTLNVEPGKLVEENGTTRLQRLEKAIGQKKIPPGITEKSLDRKAIPELYRRIINNEIQATLQARNGALECPDRIEYKQIFNFQYKDGASMTTIGGIIEDLRVKKMSEACKFDLLPFIRRTDIPFKIRVPSLTFKEIRCIDSQLPNNGYGEIYSPGLSRKDIKSYIDIYSWFPNFSEIEI